MSGTAYKNNNYITVYSITREKTTIDKRRTWARCSDEIIMCVMIMISVKKTLITRLLWISWYCDTSNANMQIHLESFQRSMNAEISINVTSCEWMNAYMYLNINSCVCLFDYRPVEKLHIAPLIHLLSHSLALCIYPFPFLTVSVLKQNTKQTLSPRLWSFSHICRFNYAISRNQTFV